MSSVEWTVDGTLHTGELVGLATTLLDTGHRLTTDCMDCVLGSCDHKGSGSMDPYAALYSGNFMTG